MLLVINASFLVTYLLVLICWQLNFFVKSLCLQVLIPCKDIAIQISDIFLRQCTALARLLFTFCVALLYVLLTLLFSTLGVTIKI